MATSNVDVKDERIAGIASSIRVIPDFPKPGIMFQDVTTLLLDPKAFKDTIDLFVERYRDKNINVIAGIEARGFIFGPPIALAIGAKFVPMRKPKKLPGEVISEEYSLEYGTDKIEMHVGAVQAGERAVIVDDLIATGGTLNAAIRLLERVGVTVVECACVIELAELKLASLFCEFGLPYTLNITSPRLATVSSYQISLKDREGTLSFGKFMMVGRNWATNHCLFL
ncbi:adenine phosphoribosyltransferase 1-like isoform X1 [Salvia splendens]|uniref:adenine phosphoribosyltransferase 1-like isoform X1 n=1 Tax=Salvia splendens TaxID=180675 RepID=UPI001C275370|nr:adenine phosphoribosyltransferase 1-like isoform X1 [Salvia splendens]